MPQISVIVPVYNVENKIRRCIDSILVQSFTDFELLLMDDGSLDQSGRICDKYAKDNDRVRVIHQKNQGPSVARNNGVKAAIGEYIAFVDSDDYVSEDYLSVLYQTIVHSSADIVLCNYYTVSDGRTLIENRHHFADNQVLNVNDIKSQFYHDVFYNMNTAGYFSPWNKLFRRKIISDYQIFMNETMSFGEDMLFVMEYIKHCRRMVFSTKRLYYYEMLPTGLFSKYRRSFLHDIMICYDSLVEQTKPDDITKYDYIPLSKKYWYYINIYVQGIIKNEKNINRRIRKAFSDQKVKVLFTRIAALSNEEIEQYNIAPSEIKVPRLVSNNKLSIATFVERYQLDEQFWLRKIRRVLHI